MSERLLKMAEAAEESGCHVKTLRKAAACGDLVLTRLASGPRSDRVHPDDLAAFWKRRRVMKCQSPSVQTAAIKSPCVTADARIAKLLGTGHTPTRKATNASGSQTSVKLRLVGNRID